jgi:hypothetical protein
MSPDAPGSPGHARTVSATNSWPDQARGGWPATSVSMWTSVPTQLRTLLATSDLDAWPRSEYARRARIECLSYAGKTVSDTTGADAGTSSMGGH